MQAEAACEALRRAAITRESSSSQLRVRYRTADVSSGLVLAQAFIDNLAQKIVLGPGEVFHFRDQFRPHPVDSGQDKRRSEAAVTRRRLVKRHPGRRQRLQAAPQPFKLGMSDAGAARPA